MYPKLKPNATLKGHLASVPSHEDYMVFADPGFAETLTANQYALLIHCNGQLSLDEITSKYTEGEQQSVRDYLTKSITSKYSLDWHTKPTNNGFSACQVPEPCSTPVSLNQVVLHLTNVCNFRCEHCYHNDYQRGKELNIEHIEKLAGEMSALNASSVTLTGGEPFLRNDLLDICQIFKEHFISVTINTNGFFITPNHIEALRDARVSGLSISVDGPTATIHDSIRKHPGSWEKIMDLLPLLKEAGLNYNISSLATQPWLDDIPSIYDFIERLNTNDTGSWAIYSASPTGEAYRTGFSDNYKLTPAKNVQLARLIRDYLIDKQPSSLGAVSILKMFRWVFGQTHPVMSLDDYKHRQGNGSEILCEEHKDILYMEPDGEVPFCTLYKSRFPLTIGHYPDESLETIWEKLCQIRISHPIEKRKQCGSCNLLSYCGGGCPGEDPTKSADFLTTCDISNKSIIPLVMDEYQQLELSNT